MAKPQYSGPWVRIRQRVLERDGYICQVHGPKCQGTATEVDHIVPVVDGGAWFDEANLRASCGPCNRGRANGARDKWQRAGTRIILVVGPPGAGKTSHVRTHRRPGDLVVDYDALAEALGSDVTHDHGQGMHGVVSAARNAVLSALRGGRADVRRAWIISANPDAESIFPWHERVVVDPGRGEAIRRAQAAGRPARWLALIDEWYAARAAPVQAESPSRTW